MQPEISFYILQLNIDFRARILHPFSEQNTLVILRGSTSEMPLLRGNLTLQMSGLCYPCHMLEYQNIAKWLKHYIYPINIHVL